jgi:hypothetical protein
VKNDNFDQVKFDQVIICLFKACEINFVRSYLVEELLRSEPEDVVDLFLRQVGLVAAAHAGLKIIRYI